MAEDPRSRLPERSISDVFAASDYVAEEAVETTVDLALELAKPLLVEGHPGTGKTELAKVLADGFETELIRLQCYEGLTAERALYEWNYVKQVLTLQADPADGPLDETVFTEEYLLDRPLLRALRPEGEKPPVLLIDEIDRADEEFEALLLELLSDFQISIPEYGTIEAPVRPIVIITSNRTRTLSEALKRRCLYLYLELPTFEKERAIVERKVPELETAVADHLCAITSRLRSESLLGPPGVAETLDWARAVASLDGYAEDGSLSPATIEQTLGCLLKDPADLSHVDATYLDELAELEPEDVAPER